MSADRAVSEVIGFVLVFSLVASMVAIISVSGLGVLEDTRNNEQLNNAERAFDVLADNVADIHRAGAPSRATEISLERARLEPGAEVSVNVTGVDPSGPNDAVTYSSTPITYVSTDGDATLVYSGGAVFRQERGGGVVIEEPPFLVGPNRVHVPIIQTQQATAGRSVGGQTVRVRAERRLREPVPSLTRHASPYHDVIINVTSPRRDLWARYFEDQPATSCTKPKPDNVRCTVTDPDRVYVTRIVINYEFET